jgi:2-polyprenyl-3-methyl-5-hydroxy-6-metoxy-1,4-benzoquinol methylase
MEVADSAVTTTKYNSADLEEVGCPTCGPAARNRLLFQRTDGLGIRLCDGCGLMFVSPRLTPRKLAEIYESEDFADITVFDNFNYDQWKQQAGYVVNALSSYKVKAMLLDLVAKYVPPGGRLLDVGSGFGLTVYEANRRGFHAEGIDISQRLATLAHEKLGVTVHCGPVEKAHLDANRFNGVIFWDVLEHVHNPLEILAEILRILRPGGYLFGQVPNWRGLTNRYKTFLNRHGLAHKQFKHFGIPHHVFNFDERSLRRMLEQAGFEVVYCRCWSKLKYKINPSPVSRWFHETLERRNLTDYLAFVAQKPA